MDVVPCFADVDPNGDVGFAMDAFGTRSGIRFALRAGLCRRQIAGVSFCREPRWRATKVLASCVERRPTRRMPRGHSRDFAMDVR